MCSSCTAPASAASSPSSRPRFAFSVKLSSHPSRCLSLQNLSTNARSLLYLPHGETPSSAPPLLLLSQTATFPLALPSPVPLDARGTCSSAPSPSPLSSPSSSKEHHGRTFTLLSTHLASSAITSGSTKTAATSSSATSFRDTAMRWRCTLSNSKNLTCASTSTSSRCSVRSLLPLLLQFESISPASPQ